MCLMLQLLLPLVVTTLLIMAVVQTEGKAWTREKNLRFLDTFATNCDPVPTKEQIEDLMANKRDTDRGTKCVRYCVMEQFDMVIEGTNQINKEKVKDFIEILFPYKEEVANEIIDKCIRDNAAFTDNCEAVHETTFCVIDEFDARGYKRQEVERNSQS